MSENLENEPFSHFNLEGAKRFLDDLEKSSRDKYFRLCYQALITNTEDVLTNDADADIKCKGITKLITYFKEREEYEKCSKLQKLLKMI
jgi:hypothetical protein